MKKDKEKLDITPISAEFQAFLFVLLSEGKDENNDLSEDLIDHSLGLILDIFDRVARFGLGLLGLPFGFVLGVAGDIADDFLDLAFDVFGGGFNSIFNRHDKNLL